MATQAGGDYITKTIVHPYGHGLAVTIPKEVRDWMDRIEKGKKLEWIPVVLSESTRGAIVVIEGDTELILVAPGMEASIVPKK